jgi:hypothetical protein
MKPLENVWPDLVKGVDTEFGNGRWNPKERQKHADADQNSTLPSHVRLQHIEQHCGEVCPISQWPI